MRLPPLNALKAFEAAARHEGFIGAAEELNVSRGAISRHVKLLEDHLGVMLFTRQVHGVRLTSAGKRLAPVLTEAFGTIASQAERIVADAADLRIICPPATSIRWLMPKLEDFRARNPNIRLRLTTEFFGDGGFDAIEHEIAFSVEHWPNRAKNIEVMSLFPLYLTPACAPHLLEGRAPAYTPGALSDIPLLHETPTHRDWTSWVEFFEVDALDPSKGDNFPNLDMATKAAVMGAGMVMADLVLCRDELDSGALVAPFPDMVCEYPLGGVCILGGSDRWYEPKVEAFKKWVLEMAQNECDNLAGLTLLSK